MTDLCICSSLLSEEAVTRLRQDYHVIPLPPDDTLPPPIRCHPDSIFAAVGDCLIFPESYAEAHPQTVREIQTYGNFRMILSDAPRGSFYPLDAGLNAAVGRDFILCRPESADPCLLKTADSCGLKRIPVRQGYAGCSCLVTDAGVLTFDAGIARTLLQHDIPHVLLQSGGIMLPGYDSGFFGGACGFHSGVIFVNGDPTSLPCFAALSDFACQNGYDILPLTNDPVTDVGGLRFFSR